MEKIKRFTEDDGGYHGELGFNCIGCDCMHFINDEKTNQQGGPIWGFNNNFEKPTITPSILFVVRTKNPITYEWDIEKKRCHSFITDGKIQFLSDCTHKLAGQTIELPEINSKNID